MAHLRKQIRDNVVTALTGLTTTGTNVFQSRVYSNENAKLPLLNIYTLNETAERITMGENPKYQRNLELVVEGYAKATSNLDNTLDTIGLEVEEALAADLTRGGLAKDTLLQSVEIEMLGDGEQPIGMIRLILEIIYVATAADVENSG